MPTDDDPAAFQAQLAGMVSCLTKLIAAAIDLRTSRGFQPDATSKAMAQIEERQRYAGTWGRDPVSAALDAAQLMVAAAEDVIGAMLRVVEADTASIFAPQVLSRSALELLGRARWLADPEIETRRRIARYMTERIYSVAELRKIHPSRKEHSDRIQRMILEEAERQGFRKLSVKGRPPAIGEPRPSQTEAIASLMLDSATANAGTTLMRYYSAVTHGTLWGLLQSAREPVEDIPGLGRQMRGLRVSTTEINTMLCGVTFGYIPRDRSVLRIARMGR
jgi:hypothetical protein